jgi:hypothetical protein
MLKLLIGVALSTLILGALVFMPYFINYSYMPNLWFGLNNLAFLMSGLVIGGLIYREFFTDELPDITKAIPPTSGYLKKYVGDKGRPINYIQENDSLGGNNAN